MIENVVDCMNENPVNPTKLHELVLGMNRVDVADAFELLSREKATQLFRLLPKSMAAEVFSYIVHERQQTIVESLTDAEAGIIIDNLFVDDAVDFIEEMPANVVKRVLRNVSDDKRQLINQILRYPEDSAGSIMTTEYVDLREDMTVVEAFDMIRAIGVNKETIYTCYVIKRDKVLVGVVTVKTLLLANQNAHIKDVMDTNLIFANTTDDQESVADIFMRYSLLSLPVVDKERRLVGIVTVDDIVQVIEEEATEDIEKMAALNPLEEPYLSAGVLKHSRNRIFWLIFLMFSATITQIILANFEEAIAVLPVLVTFIPLLMDTGGNSGAQSSTLIVRGLALGEIELKDVFKVLWYEMRIGVICGTVLGAANFIRVYLTNNGDYLLCLTISLTLVVTVILSKTVGALLPLVAKRLRMDPAVMAAPIVTTIVDGVALVVYFSIARTILGI